MKLTEEQKNNGMRYCVLRLISIDILHDRFIELQQMYEALNLKDNRKLIEKMHESRNVGTIFTKMIYTDMLLVIDDYLKINTKYFDLFEKLYDKRYPLSKKLFIEAESNYIKTGKPYVTRKKMPQISFEEKFLFNYYIYKSDDINDPEVFPSFDYKTDMNDLMNAFYFKEKDYYDDLLMFDVESLEEWEVKKNSNDKSYVLSSLQFQKYIRKRRTELAEHFDVEEKHLAEYIHELMKSNSVDGIYERKYGINGIIEDFTKSIIGDQNGGHYWLNLMTSTENTEVVGVKYEPDVDRIIENYYKSIVTEKYFECLLKKEKFTRLTLSRECSFLDVDEDADFILCMYEMDVIYKMFSLMLEQYYKDFSWEKITNQGLKKRYENNIDNLKRIIDDKDIKIKSLAKKNESLSIQMVTQTSKDNAPLVAENNKLLKQLEEKNQELEKLKEKLQWQEEFSLELSKPEDTSDMIIQYDLEILQSKRYLFVGRLDILKDFKHKFPNSIFMDAETANISGADVDAVVLLIRFMSHSMYYKVKSSRILERTEYVMCNGKSTDTVLREMYENLNMK